MCYTGLVLAVHRSSLVDTSLLQYTQSMTLPQSECFELPPRYNQLRPCVSRSKATTCVNATIRVHRYLCCRFHTWLAPCSAAHSTALVYMHDVCVTTDAIPQYESHLGRLGQFGSLHIALIHSAVPKSTRRAKGVGCISK